MAHPRPPCHPRVLALLGRAGGLGVDCPVQDGVLLHNVLPPSPSTPAQHPRPLTPPQHPRTPRTHPPTTASLSLVSVGKGTQYSVRNEWRRKRMHTLSSYEFIATIGMRH